MKSPRVVAFTILLATTTVFGQSLSLQGNGPVFPVLDQCPIGLQVDHGTFFQEREVKSGPQTVLQQRIHLTMTNRRAQTIVSALFTVHGLSQKARMIDLSTPVPDMAKTIQLALDVKGNNQASSDLSLSRFAVVTAVDVNAVTYADGSSWREPLAGACSVTPSALMRVSVAH